MVFNNRKSYCSHSYAYGNPAAANPFPFNVTFSTRKMVWNPLKPSHRTESIRKQALLKKQKRLLLVFRMCCFGRGARRGWTPKAEGEGKCRRLGRKLRLLDILCMKFDIGKQLKVKVGVFLCHAHPRPICVPERHCVGGCAPIPEDGALQNDFFTNKIQKSTCNSATRHI